MNDNPRYPALVFDWLTPIYDVFAKVFLPEEHFKRELILRAHIAPGHKVLDFGAGSGTLAILLKQHQLDAQIIGLDGDPHILAIAQEKASSANVQVTFDVGNVAAMPYRNDSFDRVLSNLLTSLLSREVKPLAVQESYRVLRSGGELYIADFGKPHTRWGRWVAPLMRRFEPIVDNLDGRLPFLLCEAGFQNVQEICHYATFFGTLSILMGRKSA